LDFKKTKCCLSAKKKLNNLKNFWMKARSSKFTIRILERKQKSEILQRKLSILNVSPTEDNSWLFTSMRATRLMYEISWLIGTQNFLWTFYSFRVKRVKMMNWIAR
jgi:hypothetical protein